MGRGADDAGWGEGGVGYGYGLGVGGISDTFAPPWSHIKSYYRIVLKRLYNVYLHMLTITDKP